MSEPAAPEADLDSAAPDLVPAVAPVPPVVVEAPGVVRENPTPNGRQQFRTTHKPKMPDGPPPPPAVQKLRVRYGRTGPLRFSSHRDVARVVERALRRARIPMAYSAGFTPHPQLSYLGACPTGVASLAEYLELRVSTACDAEAVLAALDAATPPDLPVIAVRPYAVGEGGTFADRLDASLWTVELPGVDDAVAATAVGAFLAQTEVLVERKTKDGTRTLDARAAIVTLEVAAGKTGAGQTGAAQAGAGQTGAGQTGAAQTTGAGPCATLSLVVRHTTPAVRPDDVLTGLRTVAGLVPPQPSRVTRLAQGRLQEDGTLSDPFDD